MTMTKKQFRWILLAYFVIVVISYATNRVTKTMIPDFVLTAERGCIDSRFPPLSKSVYSQIIILSLGGVIAAEVLGFISMFWFSRFGFFTFFCAVFFQICAYPLVWPWHVETGWHGCIGAVGQVFEGIIFSLVFFGPAKHLFLLRKAA